MKYEVIGTMEFNVSMTVEAENEAEAMQKANDRMDEGSFDGFTINEAIGNNEISAILEA